MVLIVIISVIMYFVIIAWTWHGLAEIEKSKKIIIIITSLILMFFLTSIIFNISKNGVNYNNINNLNAQTSVKNVLVAVFTGINGIIIIPQLAKTIGKISEDEISKNAASNRLIVILIVFIICTIIECNYMKNIQQEILNIYSYNSQNKNNNSQT